MTLQLVVFCIFLTTVYCHESGSAEANKIEMTPFFDTLIFSDVADIINEFENGNPLESLLNSGSDSEENLEDLLSEYQHYLERAHKQRINYLEKSKTKNKVPLKRHDRFSKTKPDGGSKYDDYYFAGNYINGMKFPQAQDRNPIDPFVPFSQKFTYVGKNDLNTQLPKEDYSTYEKGMLRISPIFSKARNDPIKSSCFCKSAQLPCDCKCKQCLVPYDSLPPNYYQSSKYSTPTNTGLLPYTESVSEDKLQDMSDNTLNIRIKVDVQLPNTKEIFTKILKNRSHEEMSSKESTVNVPFPYFNFPIPMELFGYKKSSKTKSQANSQTNTHKITIHKKKKSRSSNGNKKHRKKIITFHNLNLQPQKPKIQPYFDDITNTSIDYNEKPTESVITTSPGRTETDRFNQTTTSPGFNATTTANVDTNNITTNNIHNESQTEESIYVMVNISNSSDNATEDIHKTENSVETEFTKPDGNISTKKLLNLRKKRDISTQTQSSISSTTPLSTENVTSIVKNISAPLKIVDSSKSSIISVKNNETKKNDKALLADAELVYWPNVNKNLTAITSKNITTIILEREHQKAKLNMTKETIRHNRSTALEKAIFGEANWDDVDTVAPVFLSFVGKYLRGLLTFCSQNVCHSMKCAEKTCVHRICHPSDRWNQRGHCVGSKITDSVASLESIMDLPSNVAFEIVDILQDRMLGKLFGKMTLCINSKCITFVAVKKNFLKSKCSLKELKMDHCPNIKNFKIL